MVARGLESSCTEVVTGGLLLVSLGYTETVTETKQNTTKSNKTECGGRKDDGS